MTNIAHRSGPTSFELAKIAGEIEKRTIKEGFDPRDLIKAERDAALPCGQDKCCIDAGLCPFVQQELNTLPRISAGSAIVIGLKICLNSLDITNEHGEK